MSKLNGKGVLAAGALATALAGQGANANPGIDPVVDTTTQSVATLTCPDGQVRVVSVRHGESCETPTQPTEHALTGEKEGMSSPITPPTPQTNLYEPSHNRTQAKFGPVISGKHAGVNMSGVLDRGGVALGADTTITTKTQNFFAAIGFSITDDATGLVTVSYDQRDAADALGNPEYQGKLRGWSASAGVFWKQAFFQYLREQGIKNHNLNTKYTRTSAMSREIFDNFLRETTITTDTETITLWDAIHRDSLRAGYIWDIGERTRITLAGGITKPSNGKAIPTGSMKAEYYAGSYKTSGGVVMNGKFVTASTGVDYILGKHTTLGAEIFHTPGREGIPSNTGGRVVLRVTEAPVNSYVRPTLQQDNTPGAHVEGAIHDQWLHANAATLGHVAQKVTQNVTKNTTEKNLDAEPVKDLTATVNPNNTITVGFSMRSGYTYQIRVDGGAFVAGSSGYTTAVLTPGSHTITVREVNTRDPKIYADNTITKELKSLNSVSVLGTPTLSVGGNTITVTESGITDKDGVRALVYTLRGTNYTATNTTGVFSGLANGSYTLIVDAQTLNADTQAWEAVQSKPASATVNVAPVVTSTPLQIGTIACTATTITEGSSTTCSITPVDPEGVASVSATIDGTSIPVVVNAGTYSVSLTSLAVGTHTLTWSAVGKRSDGTLEPSQTATQSLTVSALPVKPPVPTCTADDTANTINCGALDPATLQVSTDGGTSWTAFSTVTTYPGNQTVLVRVKAQGVNPPSDIQTLKFMENIPDNTAPTAVNFTPATTTLTAGSLMVGQVVGQLSCTDFAPVGTQDSCTYSGGDTNFLVATNGTVTVKNATLPAGTHQFPVVATDAGGLPKASTVTVIVEKPVLIAPTLSFVSNTVTKTVGETYTQPLTTNSTGAITWASSNTSVATVDANGTVTLLSPGRATITANQGSDTLHTAATVSYTLTVLAANTAPTAVNFTPATTTLTAGALTVGQVVGQLSCTDFAPVGAQNSCIYSGGNADFAVGADGKVTIKNTALSAGSYQPPVVATDSGGLTKSGTISITVNAAPDTTAPTQLTSTNLGSITLGNNTLTKTLSFDENIASATITGLPTGITASTPTISGKDVTFTLTVDPKTYTFTNASDTVNFTLTVKDAANNSRNTTESTTLNDVAPNFAAQADATRGDKGGFLPIDPVTNVCPTGTDQFGRSITCSVTIQLVSGGINTGGISYDQSTNSVGGTVDIYVDSVFQIQRKVKATNGALYQNTNSTLTMNDQG